MFSRIACTTLLLLASAKTFASFIYADDFAPGQDVSRLTENATLSWSEGSDITTASTIFGPAGFYHQHFGGLTSATTYDTFPGVYIENQSPVPQRYAALTIDFDTPIRSFGFSAENRTSSPFGMGLFDTQGNLLDFLFLHVTRTGLQSPDNVPIFDATYYLNFNFDVAKIKIGGASDGGYIYGLDVEVAEPSSVGLLCVGFLSIVAARRSKLRPTKK